MSQMPSLLNTKLVLPKKGYKPAAPPMNPKDLLKFDRGAFSMKLFHAGFKDTQKAARLLDAIAHLIPVDQPVFSEHADRVVISFNYLRRKDDLTASTQWFNFFHHKLQMLMSPFTLEVTHGAVGSFSQVKLMLIKRQVLALVDNGGAEMPSRLDNWKSVSQEVACYPDEAFKAGTVSAEQADLNIVSYVLMTTNATKLKTMEVGRVEKYHWAQILIRTSEYDKTKIAEFIEKYPKHIQERYRFMVMHQITGQTSVEILRRVSLD